ncbi:glycosyltransferase [Synechococcus sp. L2F]|uniref:glycosyltransferase family 2 protein n=1 Tax=Synechococcus sp. L2F TaxID=2823739 RepID=UPI0020CBFFAB|nr:glycosyltransferase [Synechococcus sp. L2F]MCP9827921.1 glycosyltransferase [Synechococcus sp. L2F]
MPRDPLAWLPLLRHWTHCLGEGSEAIAGMGDLAALADLDMAALLPGGPGWADVQRCLRHDPEGAFRLLYYGLALRGLEALPAPALLVAPESSAVPQVTVLIPVHNHWPITLNALRSLVAMANGTSFEVIVADDASSDATTQLGRQLPWLRIWRSEHNQGFLDTCNGAAALARGEVLLLLNNDVLVGDHCLDRLWDTFACHSEAGVVGAAAWGADGLPQEVGGIVWADGQVWNHGRGFPLEHCFALAYARSCDYVSGCALAIRRQLWQELAGFDRRYCPAYAEDSDLCLRARQAGQSVWVQPQARILHLEGLSHSRDMAQGLKAHQRRNLEQLRERWQHLLDTQQPPAGHPWLLAADRALLGRPLAVLLQPSREASAECRRLGYSPLALGESPQADVLGLPLGWRDLERWVLEQLPEAGGPQVVLVGQAEGAAAELVERWQRARPEWQAVASAAALPLQPLEPTMPALPGWERSDLRVLASSSGLHADGWLETPCRLVIQLVGDGHKTEGVRLQLYLPEEGVMEAEPAVLFHLEGWDEPRQVRLQPGLTVVDVRSEPKTTPWLVLTIHGEPQVRASNPHDQRRLLAVLNDLSVVPLCPASQAHLG